MVSHETANLQMPLFTKRTTIKFNIPEPQGSSSTLKASPQQPLRPTNQIPIELHGGVPAEASVTEANIGDKKYTKSLLASIYPKKF